MRGAAKFFNTLADVENSFKVDKEGTKEGIRKLLEGRFIWVDRGPLEGIGITNDTFKVVSVNESENPDEEKVVNHQFELVEDPNAWMFRIGLTVDKANEYLNS